MWSGRLPGLAHSAALAQKGLGKQCSRMHDHGHWTGLLSLWTFAETGTVLVDVGNQGCFAFGLN